MLRGVVLGVIALLACVGAASATQPAGPLALELEHSRPRCTSGTLTEVSWSIRGGVPPYALTINGEAVDPDAASARVPCGSAVDDAVEWLLGIGGERYITAAVTDAAGATAREHAHVVLVAGRRAPVNIHLASKIGAFDTRVVTAEWRSGHHQPWRSREYLVRWRPQGTAAWRYDSASNTTLLRNGEVEWTVDASHAAQILEYQFADLRHPLEAETPEALTWSAPETVTVVARPRNLTATTTRDSISLSWGPDVPGLRYTARVSHDYDRLRVVGDGVLPYTAHFDGLLPDTWYTVDVSLEGKYWLEFEVRTEPALPGWSRRLREPRNLEARLVDGSLRLTWDAPLEGPERGYWACVATPGIAPYVHEECEAASAGEHQATFEHVSTGGTYRIRVTHMLLPRETIERTVYVHHPASETSTGEGLVPAPQVSHDGWAHEHDGWWTSDSPDWTMFLISWPPGVAADLAEIEWEVEGRKFFRQTTDHETRLYTTELDPVPFRIRYLQDGVWTRWSEAVLPSLVPSRPTRVELDEYAGSLVIRWRESIRSDVLAGYRVYVSRNDGEEDVLDVGRARSATYPIDLEGAEYSVSVAAYNKDGEESRRRWADDPYRPGALPTARLSFRDDRCVRGAGGEIEVKWALNGGAGPFLVAIDDAPPFETDMRVGTAQIRCEAGDGGGEGKSAEQVVELRVTDYHGQAASDSQSVRYAEYELDPKTLQLGLFVGSVHDRYVWIAWPCGDWWAWDRELDDALVLPLSDTAVVRWRSAPGEAWRYAAGDDFPQKSYPDRRCRGRLAGLEASTLYEFQLARYDRLGQLALPELLNWTASTTATTTGPATDVRAALHPEGIEVSWRSQPDAWAYQVVVSDGDKSWWTFRERSGKTVERAVLRGLAPDASLVVNVITPPQTEGGDVLRPMFEYVSFGH